MKDFETQINYFRDTNNRIEATEGIKEARAIFTFSQLPDYSSYPSAFIPKRGEAFIIIFDDTARKQFETLLISQSFPNKTSAFEEVPVAEY